MNERVHTCGSQPGNFGAFNASGGSLYGAIGIAAGVALFSFIGIEVAAITAMRVDNPRKNVGRASVLGTLASAVLYLVVSAAVMGLVPHHALVGNTAPFVTAFGTIFTHGAWAGKLVAALAVVSGIGALNGWTLVTTEVARAAAQDGLFPKAFAWADRKGTAWFGVVMAALLPSLLMLWSYTTATGLTVFTDLVDLTVVTVAIPYLFSACAQLTHLVSKRRRVQGLGPGQGPDHRRGRCAVLHVGHVRRRLPGRLPGAGGRPRRSRPVRLPQGAAGTGRPGRRADGQPAPGARAGHWQVTCGC